MREHIRLDAIDGAGGEGGEGEGETEMAHQRMGDGTGERYEWNDSHHPADDAASNARSNRPRAATGDEEALRMQPGEEWTSIQVNPEAAAAAGTSAAATKKEKKKKKNKKGAAGGVGIRDASDEENDAALFDL